MSYFQIESASGEKNAIGARCSSCEKSAIGVRCASGEKIADEKCLLGELQAYGEGKGRFQLRLVRFPLRPVRLVNTVFLLAVLFAVISASLPIYADEARNNQVNAGPANTKVIELPFETSPKVQSGNTTYIIKRKDSGFNPSDLNSSANYRPDASAAPGNSRSDVPSAPGNSRPAMPIAPGNSRSTAAPPVNYRTTTAAPSAPVNSSFVPPANNRAASPANNRAASPSNNRTASPAGAANPRIAAPGQSIAQNPGLPFLYRAPQDKLDHFLLAQDAKILQSYMAYYPMDRRYNSVMLRIVNRINPVLDQVFINSQEPVNFYVFLSDIGFNAKAFYRQVFFDSLLLDSLYRAAQAKVVFGTAKNDYSDQLAAYVASLAVNRMFGAPLAQGMFLDTGNPYKIGPPPGVKPNMAPEVEETFENMLAPFVCHELSHCMVGHCKQKLQEIMRVSVQYKDKIPQNVLNDFIKNQLSLQMTQEAEFEADKYGAAVSYLAGYPLQGYYDGLSLLGSVERYTGVNNVDANARTHMSSEARFAVVAEIYEKLDELNQNK